MQNITEILEMLDYMVINVIGGVEKGRVILGTLLMLGGTGMLAMGTVRLRRNPSILFGFALSGTFTDKIVRML